MCSALEKTDTVCSSCLPRVCYHGLVFLLRESISVGYCCKCGCLVIGYANVNLLQQLLILICLDTPCAQFVCSCWLSTRSFSSCVQWPLIWFARGSPVQMFLSCLIHTYEHGVFVDCLVFQYHFHFGAMLHQLCFARQKFLYLVF